MMMVADEWYIYTGEAIIIPRNVTRVRIHESLTVIPAAAFYGNRNIEEIECHDRVKTVGREAFRNCRSLTRVIMPGVEVVEDEAFYDCKALTIVGCDKLEIIGLGAFAQCPSLRRVIMPGVKVVEQCAFSCCYALTDVECDKLEIIEESAFDGCESLTSINLPSAKTVGGRAFCDCHALTNVVFGKALESIGRAAFVHCTSLERITIPLKDGIIAADDIFRGCKKLERVDLVEGEVHEIIAALLLEEWKNDMDREMLSINQILSYTSAGKWGDVGGKAQAVRIWIRSVLRKIIHYKAQHQSLLNEAATALQHAFPQDIVIKSVLPFLELPNMNMQR